MKVKIIPSSFGINVLEKKVNEFIKGKDILDIKIQINDKLLVAMIIYNNMVKHEIR